MNKTIMKQTLYTACLVLSFAMLSCNTQKTEDTPQETSIAEQASAEEKLCFRTEYPYQTEDGRDLADVEELNLEVKGDVVHGTFAWTPAEKGGISGQFIGTRKGNVIDATYDEINSDALFPIKIILSADEAVVSSSEESFGSFTLKKVDCRSDLFL